MPSFVVVSDDFAVDAPPLLQAASSTMAAAAGKMHWFTFSIDYTDASFGVVLLGNAFLMLYPHTACQTVVQRYFTTATDRGAKAAPVRSSRPLTLPNSLKKF